MYVDECDHSYKSGYSHLLSRFLPISSSLSLTSSTFLAFLFSLLITVSFRVFNTYRWRTNTACGKTALHKVILEQYNVTMLHSTMLTEILQIFLDAPWINAKMSRSMRGWYWIKSVSPTSCLLPIPFPLFSAYSPLQHRNSKSDIYLLYFIIYWQLYTVYSALIYCSLVAARLNQAETFWLAGLPWPSVHTPECWLSKTTGDQKTSLQDVRTQWSNSVLLRICILKKNKTTCAYHTSLSKPFFQSTKTVGKWELAMLFPILFLISSNVNIIFQLYFSQILSNGMCSS